MFNIEKFIDIDYLKENNGKKFDICLMNPPYDGGQHLYIKFLDKVINLSKISITVNPINFIFSKTNRGIHKQLKNTLNNHNTEIEEIDGNKVFKDASFLGFNLGICKFNEKTNNENITINYLNGETRKYISKDDVTRVDLSNKYVKSIIEKLNKYNNKLWDIFNFLPHYTGYGERKKIKEFKDDQLFVFLPIKTEDNVNYSFFSNKQNSKRNNVLTVGDKQTSGGIAVNSIKEGENIIKYLKTDIVRFGFYLHLNNFESGYWGFKFIPTVNFNSNLFENSLSYINEKLYDKFNLTQEEKEYIQNKIPDYYHIRKGSS